MPTQENHPSILAIDTGGTFTDFFLLGPESLRIHKVLSTPDNPALAILQGIREMKLDQNFEIVHGTTVATNAFLERKGAKTALFTTQGFEDILTIGRQNRSELFKLELQRKAELVPFSLRFGVEERIHADGTIARALTKKHLSEIFKKSKARKFDSIAICLLSSYKNSQHERVLAKQLKKLKLPISISSEICPEYREYERCSTTCINAFVTPKMEKYLQNLQQKISQPIRVMQSNGGALSITEATEAAIRTLLSGPAGGALGAQRIGIETKCSKLLTLDMGGTSTDMSLIDGQLELSSETMMDGLPVKTPMIRIDTIGAGGGSIAWRDAGGSLRVGPHSAGAQPGPVCYNNGGKQIALTDAHVFLGRIPEKNFLGGRMQLAGEKITRPLQQLGRSLKLTPQQTADGIITVANNNMARALKILSLERGYDPRDFTLVPFGGAGGLHACELAEILKVPRVIVPQNPGILSAYGMAYADWVRDYVRTLLWTEQEVSQRKIDRVLAELRTKARKDLSADRKQHHHLEFTAQMDIRYQGQSYELGIPVQSDFRKAFAKAHQKLYGFQHQRPLEIVNLRLQARIPQSIASKRPRNKPPTTMTSKPEKQKLYWQGKEYQAKILHRRTLPKGYQLKGPAIICELSATTFLPPKWKLEVDQFLHLHLRPM